jgi:hypothetical protein
MVYIFFFMHLSQHQIRTPCRIGPFPEFAHSRPHRQKRLKLKWGIYFKIRLFLDYQYRRLDRTRLN